MLHEIYDLAAGHVPAVVVTVLLLASTCCEVSKIPFNPWSWIGKMFSRLLRAADDALNGDLYEQIGRIGSKT